MPANLNEISDSQLIQLLQDGQHRYFSRLTDRYEKFIFEKCRSYVKDPAAASDLTQEILIKVFLNIKNFRSEAKFSTWLFSIVHHACVDYMRKHRKNVHEVISEKLAEKVPDIVNSDEVLPQEKTMEVLEELLSEMTPEEKLILLLKYKENHPIKDIQVTMHLSESAVKMRLKRAKDKLNDLYLKKINQR